MINEEIKETINIAIALFLVAAVLTLFLFVGSLKNEMSASMNEAKMGQTTEHLIEQLDGYNDNFIYGSDVVSLLMEFSNKEDYFVWVNGIKYKDKADTTDNILLYNDKYAIFKYTALTPTLNFTCSDTIYNSDGSVKETKSKAYKYGRFTTPGLETFTTYNLVNNSDKTRDFTVENMTVGPSKVYIDPETTYYCILLSDVPLDSSSLRNLWEKARGATGTDYRVENGDYNLVNGILLFYLGEGKHKYYQNESTIRIETCCNDVDCNARAFSKTVDYYKSILSSHTENPLRYVLKVVKQ